MAASKKKKRTTQLSAGRPPHVKISSAALSASATRTLIRSHHRLHKELYKAQQTGNVATTRDIQHRIDALGGLQSYQQASILGQSKDRGGDSSIVLMQWLEPVETRLRTASPRLRLLEVGALSMQNACSRSGIFDVQRIDLNSQADGIVQQDFMERPLPLKDDDKFDIVSLSLVLNYVPDAAQRGEMLKRTCHFLLKRTDSVRQADQIDLPALFLVLPAPCIANSRYFNHDRLLTIMTAIGYKLTMHKQTSKLVYHLWSWTGITTRHTVPKTEVNPGATRNNFTVILNAD